MQKTPAALDVNMCDRYLKLLLVTLCATVVEHFHSEVVMFHAKLHRTYVKFAHFISLVDWHTENNKDFKKTPALLWSTLSGVFSYSGVKFRSFFPVEQNCVISI